MPFFARPDLSDIQFKQLSGSTLTLSGITRISDETGFQLRGDSGYIPIIATGGSDNKVFTYQQGQIVLDYISGTTGGIYSGNSPTTYSVGGLSAGTAILGTSFSSILEQILVPTINPTITSPSVSSFLISPSDSLLEVGTNVFLTGTTTYSRGTAVPWYDSGGTCQGASISVAGLPISYEYTLFGLPLSSTSTSLSLAQKFGDPPSYSAHTISAGNNTMSVCVKYNGGSTIYNSVGDVVSTGLTSGYTSVSSRNITGIYPYFWGVESSSGAAIGSNRPTKIDIKNIITGGSANKVVETSNSTICINFNSTNDDYIWFATPSGSTSKTCWYIDNINNWKIGGSVSPGGNLFPEPEIITGVTTTCWSNQPYKVYISNYQTTSCSTIQLRNS